MAYCGGQTGATDLVDRLKASEDLGATFLVDAGAGSGKTTVLLSRIMAILKSGKGTLDRVAAITFTEKAAGEIKIRLREEVQAVLKGDALSRALLDLESAPVTTIHALAASILRERPIEAKVDPGFTILDELGSGLLLEEAWEEWKRAGLASADSVLVRAVERGMRPDDLKALGEFLVYNPEAAAFPLEGSEALDHFGNEIVPWIRGFFAHYQKKKAVRSFLDFADLLLYARDLLKNNRPVRGYFQRRFDFILVDEFQDTDPLQVEIVFYLAEQSPTADQWDRVELKKGKLFLVGDPQQSIYSFRRADIEVYRKAEEVVRNQGEVLRLSTNFRSVPSLVDAVNRVFGGLMTSQSDREEGRDYSPLLPSRSESTHPSVTVLPVPAFDGAKAAEVRETEAGIVSDFILGGREAGLFQYRDVAVLFRAGVGMEAYEEKFRDCEIPYRISGGGKFYGRQEIEAVLAVLKAVDHPEDEVDLVAALRSPFFAFSYEELFLFRRLGGRFDYLTEVLGQVDSRERFREAFAFLKKAKTLSREVPPSRLLTFLYEETHILPFFLLKPHGDQRVANLLKLVELAHALMDERPLTYRSFVEFLKRMEGIEQTESESPLMEETEEAVQIMTIHKAKGMEFPVVILADAVYKTRKDRPPILINRARNQLELKLGSGIMTPQYEDELEQKRSRAAAEEIRVLYVAATRAREMLAVPVCPIVAEGSFLYPLARSFCDATGLPQSEEPVAETLRPFGDDGPEVLVFPGKGRALKPSAGLCFEPRAAGDSSQDAYRKWHEGLTASIRASSRPSRFSVTDLVGAQDHGVSSPLGFGPKFGTYVHELLEKSRLSREWLDRYASALAEKHRLSEDRRREGVRMAEWALSSDVIRRAKTSGKFLQEVPFACPFSGGTLEGVIDLVFQEGGTLTIVDFKTDHVDGTEMEERLSIYRPQGELYAHCLQTITGIRVREVVFLFLSPRTDRAFLFEGLSEGRLWVPEVNITS